MKAKSIKGNSPEEIKNALQKSITDGFKPTLAIVFMSIKQDRNAICEILDKHDISIFGATSCGEFIDGEVGEESITILLMDMEKTNFSILIESYEGRDPGDVAEEMGIAAMKIFDNISVLISNSMEIGKRFIDGRAVIDGLERAVGSNLNIWGGNAGDDRMYDHTIVFTNHQSFPLGILLLVINADKIMIKGRAAYGWKPAGTERTITRCKNGKIYTIDDQPVLDIVFKFLGLNLTKEQSENWHPGSVVFCFSREEGAPVLRSSSRFNWDEKSITVPSIEEGAKFRFALPPDFEIVEEVSNEARQVRETEFPDADALIMFSCMLRHDELGPMISTEIDGVKNSFKAPMVGFFTYGEFGRATNGKNEFHNNTCCWVALKEK